MELEGKCSPGDAPQEISKYPFATIGSDQHIEILLSELDGEDRAFTATSKGCTDKMLILNEKQLSQLRTKGYIITVQANPMYKGA